MMTREAPHPVPATPQLFSNGEFELPVIPEGDSFRVNATVIARQLGFEKAKDMVRTLADDEKLMLEVGGEFAPRPDQAVWFITEPGFYKAVGQRNTSYIKDHKVRDAVSRFQRWVFHEVIPAMVRDGRASETALIGTTWSWVDVSFEVRQRYGLDYSASKIASGIRAAGWLRNDAAVPKHDHRTKFWFTGTAYHLLPYALPELVRALVPVMQQLGDQQASQYRLSITPSLKALTGGDS